MVKAAAETVDRIAEAKLAGGFPVPDCISGMSTRVEDDRLAFAKKIISEEKPKN